MDITWKGSPNFDNNRSPIDRIVIHWFGVGTLASANTRFQDPASDVSAHYGISGNTVYQWVKEEHVAYHAGNYEMNKRSIGIEHDATTDHPASETTYQSSAALVAEICQRHNIPLDRSHIIGHKEVKATQCPGTMDIDRIIRDAKAILTPAPTDQDRALQVLKDALVTLRRKDNGEPFGNLEGLTRELVGYFQSPPQTVTVEVPVEKVVFKEVIKVIHPAYTNSFANLLFRLAESLEGRSG